MNEYNIKCNKNRNSFPIFLCIFPLCIAIIYMIISYFFINSIMKYFYEYAFPIIIFWVFFSCGLFIFVLKYGYKLLDKNIKIIINDECININNGEKNIFLNEIKNIYLENKVSYYGITSYIINIHYNINDKTELVILTNEKKNTELFLKLWEEINNKINLRI